MVPVWLNPAAKHQQGPQITQLQPCSQLCLLSSVSQDLVSSGSQQVQNDQRQNSADIQHPPATIPHCNWTTENSQCSQYTKYYPRFQWSEDYKGIGTSPRRPTNPRWGGNCNGTVQQVVLLVSAVCRPKPYSCLIRWPVLQNQYRNQ